MMRILRVGLALLLLIGGGVVVHYQRWLRHHTRRVANEGHTAMTARGPVQYDRRGSGPVVLHVHGGNVGHNGWFMLAELLPAGFTLLTPDRPGYLGTPLGDNGSPEAQADVCVALLDALGLERVAVIGISAGGPTALQLAARYPERVSALVLLSALTQRTPLTDDQLNSTLGKLVMTRRAQNIAYYLIYQAMTRLPALTLQDYVRTETTYDPATGQRYIEQVLADPAQRQQVNALATAMVPALPRYAGVMNDLHVQSTLEPLPLDQVQAPTLIIHSEHDGDLPYANATHAAAGIPNAELITVAQFGHLLWWGDAAVTRAFEARMIAFLRAATTTGTP